MGIRMLERLIDSVIIIDHLNGIDEASEFLLNLYPEKTAISVITRAEILVGIGEDQEDLVKSFLNQYQLFEINRKVADLAARMRRTHRWKLPDAFQAAICLLNRIKLTTRNTKDFNPNKHSFVEIPYRLK